jgi:hypothetical protein
MDSSSSDSDSNQQEDEMKWLKLGLNTIQSKKRGHPLNL